MIFLLLNEEKKKWFFSPLKTYKYNLSLLLLFLLFVMFAELIWMYAWSHWSSNFFFSVRVLTEWFKKK